MIVVVVAILQALCNAIGAYLRIRTETVASATLFPAVELTCPTAVLGRTTPAFAGTACLPSFTLARWTFLSTLPSAGFACDCDHVDRGCVKIEVWFGLWSKVRNFVICQKKCIGQGHRRTKDNLARNSAWFVNALADQAQRRDFSSYI